MALQTEAYVADVLGKQAEVKALYDRAVAANAQCLRGMEVQACDARPKRFGEKGVRSGSIFFKTIYCFKGVGGTASSVVHHCSFYDGA